MNLNTTFLCPVCDVTTSSTSKLHCHLERHLGQRPFSCKLCPKKYVLKFEANRHIKEKHPGEDVDASREEDPGYQENPVVSIKCLRCGGMIKSRDDLKHHALKHSDAKVEETPRLPERPVPVPQREPSSRLKRKLRLREENRLRKLVLARWKCILCAELQPDLAELNLHLNEHLRLVQFTCSGCKLPFQTRTEAIRHLVERHGNEVTGMEVETGKEGVKDLAYSCACCGEDIRSMKSLDAHAQLHYSTSEADSSYSR